MKIGIASDHRGFKLKGIIIDYLNDRGYYCVDYGTNSEENVDYVDYAIKLCKGINNNEVELGILICGTGIGMSMAANKIKGIRCARVVNIKDAETASEHNMANVIAIPENIDNVDVVISTFINTSHSTEERYIRRVNKINEMGMEVK